MIGEQSPIVKSLVNQLEREFSPSGYTDIKQFCEGGTRKLFVSNKLVSYFF